MPKQGKILLLEDDPILAKCLGQFLVALGVPDVAIVHDNPGGLKAIESADISAAFIDVRLKTESSEKTAILLAERDIPFAFLSGEALSSSLAERFPQAHVLMKPARKEQLLEMLVKLESETRPGTS